MFQRTRIPFEGHTETAAVGQEKLRWCFCYVAAVHEGLRSHDRTNLRLVAWASLVATYQVPGMELLLLRKQAHRAILIGDLSSTILAQSTTQFRVNPIAGGGRTISSMAICKGLCFVLPSNGPRILAGHLWHEQPTCGSPIAGDAAP